MSDSNVRNVRREALHRAYYAVDEDLERLRFLLGVPLMSLCDWLAGRTPPPLPVFLRAVDVIVEAGREGIKDARKPGRHAR